MRVVKDRVGGIIRRVALLDDDGVAVEPVSGFLDHLMNAGYSPNTVCAYGYDLRYLFGFLTAEGMDWRAFGPATALTLLGFLRRIPSRHPAQRLGLAVATGEGRLLAPATVARVLAATSSFMSGRSPRGSTAGRRTRCAANRTRPRRGSLDATSPSWAARAANARSGGPCGSGCRCGCPGR